MPTVQQLHNTRLHLPAIFAAALLVLVLLPHAAHASAQDFYIPDLAGIASPGFGLVNAVISIINALLVLAAIAAVAFVIVGGVRYFSSQGDEQAVSQAKNTVIYAIIGIIVIILAAVIVSFFSTNIGS